MKHTFIHENVNGIRTHTQEKIHTLTQAYIISIHDTRLKHGQDHLHTLFPNYIIHELKHDRNTGIAVLIYNKIKHTLISTHNQDGHKSITIKISDKKIHSQDIYYTSYYVPPHNSRHNTLLKTYILQEALHHKYSIITGDFNARHIDLGCTGTNRHGKQLHAFLLQTNHSIINDTNQPTFIHAAHNFTDCLDYFITTNSLLPSFSSSFTLDDNGSDHLPLHATFKKHTQNKQEHQHDKNTLNYKQTNWPNFQTQLQTLLNNETNFKTPDTTNDLDFNINIFIQHIQTALTSNTPKFKTPNNSSPRLPPHILRLIRSRRQLRKHQLTNNNNDIRQQINELNKTIAKNIKQVKRNIDNDKLNIIKQGPRNNKFWPTIKQFTHPKQHFHPTLVINNQTHTTPLDVANTFRNFFNDIFTDTDTHLDPAHKQKLEQELPDLTQTTQRDTNSTLLSDITHAELHRALKTSNKNSAPGPDKITYTTIQHFPPIAQNILINIYNSILTLAYFPSHFKNSIITVFPKPNKDTRHPSSYRPITLTSTLGKIFEKIISTRLTTLAVHDKIIKDHQTAFRPHRDSSENVIHLAQQIVNNFNQNKYTFFITFDIQKAFDKTWHTGILHTIHQFTSTHFTKLISSFLSNRRIHIKVNNILSSHSITPIVGVPQGSCLSPTLFNILISTAPHQHPPNTYIYNYADDFSFSSHASTPTQAYNQIENTLRNFITWTKQYNLHIQSQKTQAIFFTRRRATPNSQYPTIQLQNDIINRQTQVTFLGTIFDIHFTFKHHINKINTGTHFIINTIRHLLTRHKHIPSFIGTYLYTTLVRTKFTYASPILTLIKPTSWRTLTHTEHRALRAACRTGIRTRITHMYNRTRITPLEEYYTQTGQNTLLRYAAQKHHTMLNTLFQKPTNKQITYWPPPLDFIYSSLTPQQQQIIQNSIHHPP